MSEDEEQDRLNELLEQYRRNGRVLTASHLKIDLEGGD